MMSSKVCVEPFSADFLWVWSVTSSSVEIGSSVKPSRCTLHQKRAQAAHASSKAAETTKCV